MVDLFSWDIDIITWLQSLGEWLVKPMEFFSFLGAEEFYLIIAPAIIWCWNLNLGLRMGLFLMINASINGSLKMALHNPRPYWVDSQVHAMASETSFGIPSGHAQNAAVVWGTLATHIGTRLGWLIVTITIFFIGLSRLYLGMHYPADVLAGWLLGGLLLWIFIKTSEPIVTWLKTRKLYEQIIVSFVSSLVLIVLGLTAEGVASNFPLPKEWLNNAIAAHPDVPIAPFSISGLISNAGAFFGLSAGAIWLAYKGGFSTQGVWWQLVARYLIGVSGVIILWFGLGQVFPRGETFLPYILRYLRYALVGYWASGLAPFLFIKLKLATGAIFQSTHHS